jgi:PAS domain S-box-containing protein
MLLLDGLKAELCDGDSTGSPADKALAVSELRYRRLFETAKDGILILDAETGIVVDVNPFLTELLGYSHGDFVGKTLWELGFLKDAIASRDKFLELQRQEYVRYENLPLETADGRRIEVEFVSNVYLVDGEKVIQCNVRDITARRRAEETLGQVVNELQRSNEDLQQFAYVASHDLQEPLRMVTGFLTLLQERYRGQLDGKAQEYIGYSVEGATRMSALIRDLLEYAKVGANGQQTAPVDLSAVADTVKANLRAAIEESNAVITHEPLPTLTADARQMRQLFQNLIGNALKFRVEGRRPEVHMAALQEGGEWLFRVKDNGIGIDPNQSKRLFKLFQRLHGREEYPGTGIGLAICRKIVEGHGGRIWVESVSGEGSTFCFTLPADVSRPPMPQP